MDTQEETIYTALLISCAVVGVVVVFFIISILKQQKQKLAITKKAMLIEITTMERERARIAAELHDDLGPIMSVVKFKVDHIETNDEENLLQLKEASNYLDQLIEKIRGISSNLLPVSLFRKGLVEAVEDYCKRLEGVRNINIERSYSGQASLPEEKMINIYRVIQEVLHNAIKHSEASLIKLSIENIHEQMRVQIADNGKGFEHGSAKDGLGLTLIRNRIDVIQGEMQFESGAGRGTAYLFTISKN